MIPGTGIPRNWVLRSLPVSMVPHCQREGSFWAWCVCEGPVKRWLCVLRSRVHREQNSSATPAELGLCSTADGRGNFFGRGDTHTQKQHVWVLAQRHASVRSSGDWVTVGVSQGGSKQAGVYTFTPANTHSAAKIQDTETDSSRHLYKR